MTMRTARTHKTHYLDDSDEEIIEDEILSITYYDHYPTLIERWGEDTKTRIHYENSLKIEEYVEFEEIEPTDIEEIVYEYSFSSNNQLQSIRPISHQRRQSRNFRKLHKRRVKRKIPLATEQLHQRATNLFDQMKTLTERIDEIIQSNEDKPTQLNENPLKSNEHLIECNSLSTRIKSIHDDADTPSDMIDFMPSTTSDRQTSILSESDSNALFATDEELLSTGSMQSSVISEGQRNEQNFMSADTTPSPMMQHCPVSFTDSEDAFIEESQSQQSTFSSLINEEQRVDDVIRSESIETVKNEPLTMVSTALNFLPPSSTTESIDTFKQTAHDNLFSLPSNLPQREYHRVFGIPDDVIHILNDLTEQIDRKLSDENQLQSQPEDIPADNDSTSPLTQTTVDETEDYQMLNERYDSLLNHIDRLQQMVTTEEQMQQLPPSSTIEILSSPVIQPEEAAFSFVPLQMIGDNYPWYSTRYIIADAEAQLAQLSTVTVNDEDNDGFQLIQRRKRIPSSAKDKTIPSITTETTVSPYIDLEPVILHGNLNAVNHLPIETSHVIPDSPKKKSKKKKKKIIEDILFDAPMPFSSIEINPTEFVEHIEPVPPAVTEDQPVETKIIETESNVVISPPSIPKKPPVTTTPWDAEFLIPDVAAASKKKKPKRKRRRKETTTVVETLSNPSTDDETSFKDSPLPSPTVVPIPTVIQKEKEPVPEPVDEDNEGFQVVQRRKQPTSKVKSKESTPSASPKSQHKRIFNNRTNVQSTMSNERSSSTSPPTSRQTKVHENRQPSPPIETEVINSSPVSSSNAVETAQPADSTQDESQVNEQSPPEIQVELHRSAPALIDNDVPQTITIEREETHSLDKPSVDVIDTSLTSTDDVFTQPSVIEPIKQIEEQQTTTTTENSTPVKRRKKKPRKKGKEVDHSTTTAELLSTTSSLTKQLETVETPSVSSPAATVVPSSKLDLFLPVYIRQQIDSSESAPLVSPLTEDYPQSTEKTSSKRSHLVNVITEPSNDTTLSRGFRLWFQEGHALSQSSSISKTMQSLIIQPTEINDNDDEELPQSTYVTGTVTPKRIHDQYAYCINQSESAATHLFKNQSSFDRRSTPHDANQDKTNSTTKSSTTSSSSSSAKTSENQTYNPSQKNLSYKLSPMFRSWKNISITFDDWAQFIEDRSLSDQCSTSITDNDLLPSFNCFYARPFDDESLISEVIPLDRQQRRYGDFSSSNDDSLNSELTHSFSQPMICADDRVSSRLKPSECFQRWHRPTSMSYDDDDDELVLFHSDDGLSRRIHP